MNKQDEHESASAPAVGSSAWLGIKNCECGGKAFERGAVKLQPTLNIFTGDTRYHVRCNRCKTKKMRKDGKGFLSPRTAISAWNTKMPNM